MPTNELLAEIADLRAQLADREAEIALWKKDDIAWDCLAEIASDYYRIYQSGNEEDYRCGRCHQPKNKHLGNCLVQQADGLLQALKDKGEL